MQARLEERGHDCEWAALMRDLQSVQFIGVEHQGKRFRLRTELEGTAGKAFQAAGVAVPPTVQQLTDSPEGSALPQQKG